jgi:hypothetical protein
MQNLSFIEIEIIITKLFFSRFSNQIPVTFMTGFYVANVVTRYWNQFVSLAWPDRIAFRVVGLIPGQVSLFLIQKIDI